MCRMCSYYTKLDLKQLPLSNPFLGDMTPSPVERDLPRNIVVESPESHRHTAWTNLRRFPSLERPHTVPKNLEASPSTLPSQTISIYGPRELSKNVQYAYVAYDPQRQPRAGNTHDADVSASHSRRLQHQNRVDSFPQAMMGESTSGKSSQSSTPRCLSPVSDDGGVDDDDEFSYLPSTPKIAKAYPPRVLVVGHPVKHSSASDVLVPKPLNVHQKDIPASQWMDDICRNL